MKDLKVDVKIENVEPIVTHIQDLAAVCKDVEKALDTQPINTEVKKVLESVLKLEQDLKLSLEAEELQ